MYPLLRQDKKFTISSTTVCINTFFNIMLQMQNVNSQFSMYWIWVYLYEEKGYI